ncbi:RDD family protein [Paraliomyxa miuraensis]|uniref:RDD family protein n=1 Tax=Paraliomyxa miuraensis TaxID=376150 RepID=UPI00224E26F9|nr:RDD family protein [Paraliomyxa miuraensis]MCX4239561.1 RDD family protein [Paraliomyxa miuraensis]
MGLRADDAHALRLRNLWRASCPTACPACDAGVDPATARDDDPRCPRCEQPLLPVRVAGVWLRAAAGVVDAVVLLATAGLLNFLLLRWLDLAPLLGDARGLDAMLSMLDVDPAAVLRRCAPALAMAALYFGLFWSLTGRTLGHRMLRLRVIDAYGQPPSPWRAAVRVVGHGLGLLLGAMGWLWVAFDREKRGLHDHLARTYVVRES